MRARKTYITVCAVPALLLGLAHGLFAGGLTYSRASAPWTVQQAAELAPRLTPGFLRGVGEERGPKAAAKLAEKAEKVSALLKKFGDCSLSTEDLAVSGGYFTPAALAELRYFAGEGCAAFRASAEGRRSVGRPAAAEALEAVSVSGSLYTRAGSSLFFDGSRPAQTAPAVRIPASASADRYEGLSRTIPSPRFSGAAGSGGKVPAMPEAAAAAPVPPPGPFNRAAAHWREMRKENWSAFKGGELSGAQKGKAFGKAAAGAAFGFLLWYSNLPAVETAAARLRRDRAAGAAPRVLWADAAKLAFHVGLTMIAPIPISNISAAVAAGSFWGIFVTGYIGVATVNHFLHFAD